MNKAISAVIFDMDGVLIDSEPLWRRAMVKGFSKNGMNLSEDDCRKTTGKRLGDVIVYWLDFYQLPSNLSTKTESDIVSELIFLINTEGKAMAGATDILTFAKNQGLKTGLATSSSEEIMWAVLHKLNLATMFDAIVSAQHMPYAKPHPEVFIQCAKQLQVTDNRCVVIEDSVNGVIAAKAAQMRVIAVPDNEHLQVAAFAVADYRCTQLSEALYIIRTLIN